MKHPHAATIDLHAVSRYLIGESDHTMKLAMQARKLNARKTTRAGKKGFRDFLVRFAAAADKHEAERITYAFWASVKKSGRPFIEGSTVYFMYLGKARRVSVPSDLNGWNANADVMVRLDNTNFFYLKKPIDYAKRFEYKLAVDSTWIVDPVNSQQAMGGFGPNSEIWMPGYQPTDHIRYRASIPHGKLDTLAFKSRILKRTHLCYVYLPPGYKRSTLQHPSIYVLDGGEYITLALMVNVLDSLIADNRIRPVIGVFIDPRTNIRNFRTSKRVTDYTMSERFVQFLTDEVRHHIALEYRVLRSPDETAILGASLGGLASTFAAFRRPDIFGLCAAQSPSYQWNRGSMVDSIASEPKKSIRFYIDTGTIRDAQIHSRKMKATLKAKGYEVHYAEYPEGHNWVNWRARLDEILVYFWGTHQ